MNQRIRELADATADLMPSGVYNVKYESGKKGVEFTEDALEKFAELIIRECTEQVRGQYLPVMEDKEMMNDEHWKGYVQCGVDGVVAIREHFGVES